MNKQEADAIIQKRIDAMKGEKVIRKGEFSVETPDTNVVDLHKSASKDGKVIEFQKRADDAYLLSKVLGCPIRETKLYKRLRGYMEETELAKAMSAGGANVGADWVPTGFSSQLTEMVQIERKVAAQFPSFNMTQNPYEWPVSTGFATTYLIGENTEITASDDPTSKITFAAKKMATRIDCSYELEEDAAILVLPSLKKNIAERLARAEEDTLINGCADNTMDPDNTTATDYRRAFKGLRKMAVENAYTTDLASFYADAIGPMRKKLGKFYQPSRCMWIVSVSGWEQLSRLAADATSKSPLVITMDKLGTEATMKTGVLGTLFGSPVILSEFLRDTLTADGYGTGTKAAMLLVNKEAFKIGYRGGITAESFRAVEYQTTKLVSTQRIAFQPMFAIASNHTVEYGINFAA